MIVATVLKTGGEYDASHVERLRAQVTGAEFVCLSDDSTVSERIPLIHGWPGWWSKIELFRPGLFDQPVVYLDLDTEVIGSVERLQRGDFTILSDFYRPHLPASGVMAWTGDAPHAVYEAFSADPQRWMGRYRSTMNWGDQAFIRDHCGLSDIPRFGPEVCSYKVHCKPNQAPPADACVVAFHGKPRPWECGEEWAQALAEARA